MSQATRLRIQLLSLPMHVAATAARWDWIWTLPVVLARDN
jgi:hypothetical protein